MTQWQQMVIERLDDLIWHSSHLKSNTRATWMGAIVGLVALIISVIALIKVNG